MKVLVEALCRLDYQTKFILLNQRYWVFDSRLKYV